MEDPMHVSFQQPSNSLKADQPEQPTNSQSLLSKLLRMDQAGRIQVSPGEFRSVGCRAGRGADVNLRRQLRGHRSARVLGAGIGDAGHIGEADGGRADEAEPQLQ